MSQTIFWAKIRKKTSLPPSKGKTSFAKHPEICAFSQHNLCIKPKPHLAKSGPDRGSEVYQVGFWTSPSRIKQYQPQKWTCFEAICFFEPFKMTRRNDEICENPRKSSKILDRYPTKIQKKSRLEHVQVTLSEKAWFSRPERFWSRQGNVLQPVPKFHGISSENCSDPY